MQRKARKKKLVGKEEDKGGGGGWRSNPIQDVSGRKG